MRRYISIFPQAVSHADMSSFVFALFITQGSLSCEIIGDDQQTRAFFCTWLLKQVYLTNYFAPFFVRCQGIYRVCLESCQETDKENCNRELDDTTANQDNDKVGKIQESMADNRPRSHSTKEILQKRKLVFRDVNNVRGTSYDCYFVQV